MSLLIPDLTAGYVRLVGQEPARSKCILLSTSMEVRKDMRSWVLSDAGESWTVKIDVRDLGSGGDIMIPPFGAGLPL